MRRGRGEGSIYRKRPGLWCAQLVVGYGADGRLIRRTLYGKTRTAVADELADHSSRAREGDLSAPGRQSLAELLELWHKSAERSLRAGTHARDEQILRLHVKPTLGRVPLRSLSAAHVEALYARLAERGASTRKRQAVHQVLSRALRWGVRKGFLPRNPLERVDRPRGAGDGRERIRALPREDARRLLEAARGDRYEAVYVIALTTGMRLGEILGLAWGNLDLARASLRLEASLTQTGRKKSAAPGVTEEEAPASVRLPPERAPLKTPRSRRTLALPRVAVAALERHRERLGAAPHPERLVFTSPEGEAILQRNFHRREWKPLLERAKLPAATRFHDLRHTYAVHQLEDGVAPVQVSAELGHASVGFTLERYAHVTPLLRDQASRAVDARWAGL